MSTTSTRPRVKSIIVVVEDPNTGATSARWIDGNDADAIFFGDRGKEILKKYYQHYPSLMDQAVADSSLGTATTSNFTATVKPPPVVPGASSPSVSIPAYVINDTSIETIWTTSKTLDGNEPTMIIKRPACFPDI